MAPDTLIQTKGDAPMANEPLSIEQILTTLAETPRLFAELSEGLEPELLRARPAPAEWSLNEILAHLRACADVWSGYIARILAEERPAFRGVSPRTYIRRTDYPDLEFRPSLDAFVSQREDLLAVLEPLFPDEWARAAAVTTSIQTRERSVQSYAEQLVRHESAHCRQIEEVATALRSAQPASVASAKKAPQ